MPVTILHHNDAHGNLAKGTYVGYTQLAILIQQERAHNPSRTLLLNGGDGIQGDVMMYYFKSAPSGFAADGTALPDALKPHPMLAVMNALGYDAMTLGNHEFNFGNQIVHDTQYYVRDAVIDYITAQGTVSPEIEGRLSFLKPAFYLPAIYKK